MKTYESFDKKPSLKSSKTPLAKEMKRQYHQGNIDRKDSFYEQTKGSFTRHYKKKAIKKTLNKHK